MMPGGRETDPIFPSVGREAQDVSLTSDSVSRPTTSVRVAHDVSLTSDSVSRPTAPVRVAHDLSLTSDSISGPRDVLVQVASAAIVRGTAGAPQIVVTPRPESPVPELEIGLSENIWDLTTTGVGVTVGAAVGHLPGAAVGGFALYAWGRWRWRHVQRRRDGF